MPLISVSGADGVDGDFGVVAVHAGVSVAPVADGAERGPLAFGGEGEIFARRDLVDLHVELGDAHTVPARSFVVSACRVSRYSFLSSSPSTLRASES